MRKPSKEKLAIFILAAITCQLLFWTYIANSKRDILADEVQRPMIYNTMGIPDLIW